MNQGGHIQHDAAFRPTGFAVKRGGDIEWGFGCVVFDQNEDEEPALVFAVKADEHFVFGDMDAGGANLSGLDLKEAAIAEGIG